MIWKIVLFIVFVGSINFGLGFVRLDATPHPSSNPSKGHLQNVSLYLLTSGYLKSHYPDVMSLKISNSKIDKIDKYAFDYLTHLNLLEISDNEIQERIDPQTFSRLPTLEMLVLRNVGFQNVYLNLTNVQELILAGNKIEIIVGEFIKGKNVKYLDLSNNSLRTLAGSFANMSKLSMIDISRNKIANIPPTLFEENVNLINIAAAQNRLISTKGLNLPWLKTLDLFDNRIPSLDSKSFSGMKSLEELVLAINAIDRVEDPFKDLIELKYLNLAWNSIEEIRPELFQNNLYLTKLFLQGNKIKTLDKFKSVLYHLTHLDVSHNVLTLIQDEFFHSTPSLQVLDLSFNHLKTIGDSMEILEGLKTLNLAFNMLTMNGDELSANHQLTRVNLSFNALAKVGVTHFKNNSLLSDLDLSHNDISHFCDEDIELKNLLKLNLRENQIKELNCLKNFKSLCEVDLRKNPLTCGEDLDDLVRNFATRKSSPKKFQPEFQADLLNECESLTLNQSFSLWNEVKRELCLVAENVPKETKEWESAEEPATELEEEPSAPKEIVFHKKIHIRKPIGWLKNDELEKPNPMENPQSEKISWENIEKKNSELLKGFEDEENGKKPRFTWYTIALILIGLSLTLTCFNLLVFFYIKMKVWRRNDVGSPQKYSVLHNEVYKNTTEPNKVSQLTEGDWSMENQTKNKIFAYAKINEFLLNFGLNSKDKDSESAKNILINSTSNAHNC